MAAHQTKQQLEEWYEVEDAWGYKRSKDDLIRKHWIKNVLDSLDSWFEKGIDIGAGEGFITTVLPCRNIDFIELSDNAAKRNRWGNRVTEPKGKYDIVLATGVLYEQYDYSQMRSWIIKAASKYVLTCHYDKAGKAHDKFNKEQVFYAEFPYRDGKQVLRFYKW